MNQANLAFNTNEIKTDESILAIAWNIATEPKLYRKLAQNPYSPQVLQIISERFPDANSANIIRAVVLAEPEGKYDRNFRQLSKDQQEVELQNQADIATRIHKRLVQYCKKHAKELRRLPEAVTYDILSFVVFETDDVREIEQRFSQNQRRDFRLAIVHFIKDDTRLSKVASPSGALLRRTYLVGAFIVFVSVLLFALSIGLYQKQKAVKLREAEQVLAASVLEERRELPVRLLVPSINVDAAIQSVGITIAGAMDVPSNTHDVGWYTPGPVPGQKGSAVISGHFDGREGKTGVFNNLDKLKTGDKIYIVNTLGYTTAFVVRESRTYSPGYADEVFLPNDSGIHLNLVTCDGVWNGSKKSYSKRLVVFADITK